MPHRFERLAAWVTPERDREVLLGDLREEMELRRQEEGEAAARRWYRSQVLRSVVPSLLRRRWTSRTTRNQGRRISRAGRGDGMFRELWQDARFALREYGHKPLFTLLLVGTLALGIGATTVIYSAVDGVVLHPFSYPDPETLVGVGPEFPRLNQELGFFEVLSPAEYVDIREQSRTLERVVAWDMGNRQLSGEDAPENVFTCFWWGDVFATLEVEPAAGRGFSPEEIAQGQRVAILSHRIWQRSFGGDPSLVGGRVLVNGEPYEVVGIMPEGTSIYGSDLWTPMPVGPDRFPRNRRQFQLLARISDGYELNDVATELATIAGRIEAEHRAELEEYEDWSLVPATWDTINVRQLRPMAWMLLGTVAFVLLLVCTNVANLLLGRSATRHHEIAVRQALGAGRGRLVRQLLTESVILALVGGAGGIALAVFGVRALSEGVGGTGLPIPGSIEMNGRVLSATLVLSVLSGVLFGLAPALQTVRRQVAQGLSEIGTRSTGSVRRRRMQRSFVAAEVALALILCFGGALLLNGFVRLQRIDPGFETDGVLTLRITLPWERYDQDGIQGFFSSLTERLEALPGVERAGVASQFPPRVFSRSRFTVEGREPVSEGSLPTAFTTAVSPELFATLGLKLERGRLFDETDTSTTPPVAVLNQLAVDRYFPEQDPIGQRVKLGTAEDDGPWLEIIGVVPTVLNRGVERPPEPEMYGSILQGLGANQLFVLIKSELPASSMAEAVRSEVRAIDPEQGIYAVQSMSDVFESAASPRRFATRLTLLLGGFALLLAGVGIYAVVSFAVAEHSREIGLRMALGAGGRQVLGWVLRQALMPVLVGVGLGLVGILALGRLLRGMVLGVSAADPWTIAGAVVALGTVAMLATWLPARRASRLDPVTTLRAD